MSDSAGACPQYHHMNAGAHRRPPPQIGAPALTWQRGFWVPKDQLGPEDKRTPHDSLWTQSVDNTLAHLFRSIRQTPNVAEFSSPNFDDETNILYLFNHKVINPAGPTFELEVLPSAEKAVRHVVFTVRARFCGLWLTMSARQHHENFLILFALDFSGEADGDIAEGSDLKAMSDDFITLHELIMQRYTPGQHTSPRDGTYLDDRKRSEVLSKKLIARYKRFINGITAAACSQACNDIPCSLDKFGERFSDIVGLAYSLAIKPEGLSYAYHPEDLGSLKMSAQVEGTNFCSQQGLDVLDAAWPVITGADHKTEIDRAHGDPEYVVATFNEGRTLYVSSLGRLASDASSGEFAPLIFTLIVSYSSPWRLGRFIDKLHTAGTLRLAAMRDLQKINYVSGEIYKLSRRLASEEDSYALFTGPKNIEIEFAKIDDDMEHGLAYRIDRSRYYVNSYNDTVKALRPARMQGYQFYVDFIRSRVFDAFDYIDRVGARYEGLKKEIEFRANLLRRQEARELLLATASQARAAASLLEAAEVLSVIPLTYYGGFLLMQMVEPLKRLEYLSWLPSAPIIYYSIGFLLSIALAYASHARRGRSTAKRENKAERLDAAI